MDENNSQAWYRSRTNIAAMALMACSLSALYGGKLGGLSPEAREAIVTILLLVLPPLIMWFRKMARKVIK